MPTYDYLCDDCGPFTGFRPMSESDLPSDCPACGTSAPRAFLTAPYMSGISTERRHAFATNERSAHEPKSTKSTGHGPGCGCCSGKSSRMTHKYKDGSKAFPKSRPWMISH
ncbi:MAG TPA: zinc ribbon domain-containing protein [Pseudolabrys sp.]|nr:zinc ribbon domain-containing protein [Pseudolabrys sp.]